MKKISISLFFIVIWIINYFYNFNLLKNLLFIDPNIIRDKCILHDDVKNLINSSNNVNINKSKLYNKLNNKDNKKKIIELKNYNIIKSLNIFKQ